MPRRGARKPKAPVGDISDPQGLATRLSEYLEWMRTKNYSEHTIALRALNIGLFFQWAEERGVTRPVEVTRAILERYQRHLYHLRRPNGQPLSFPSQKIRLTPLRPFFGWLAKQNYLLYNPASELEMPRTGHRLPKHVLSASEAEAVLAQPDVDDLLGLRDRAILETFYSTGMRRMELGALALYDLDLERGTVMVRQGKGQKDRMVPIGDRATSWIEKYLADARSQLAVEPDAGVLFLTVTGEAFTPNRLTHLVRDYVAAAEIGKRGACHLFRHTMATLMLEGGADIRFIQQMLGHAKLETTQIYTQVSIRKLQEIHAATHPGARLEGRRARATVRADAADENRDATAGADALLTSLAAEAAEEERDVDDRG